MNTHRIDRSRLPAAFALPADRVDDPDRPSPECIDRWMRQPLRELLDTIENQSERPFVAVRSAQISLARLHRQLNARNVIPHYWPIDDPTYARHVLPPLLTGLGLARSTDEVACLSVGELITRLNDPQATQQTLPGVFASMLEMLQRIPLTPHPVSPTLQPAPDHSREVLDTEPRRNADRKHQLEEDRQGRALELSLRNYSADNYFPGYDALAREFGVTPEQIRQIVTGDPHLSKWKTHSDPAVEAVTTYSRPMRAMYLMLASDRDGDSLDGKWWSIRRILEENRQYFSYGKSGEVIWKRATEYSDEADRKAVVTLARRMKTVLDGTDYVELVTDELTHGERVRLVWKYRE